MHVVVVAAFTERGFEPVFDVLVVNVTVVAGQTAVLPCSIDYLNKHKVRFETLIVIRASGHLVCLVMVLSLAAEQ
jgi:hypothetical protein